MDATALRDAADTTACDRANGDRLVIGDDGTLLITDRREREVRQPVASVRLPPVHAPAASPWMFAGFLYDYRWLIAGAPGGVQVFRHTPDAGRAVAPDGGGSS